MSAAPRPDPELHFDILEGAFRSVRLPPRPVNVFELSGFPRWETVSSNVLAYFLDPRDERHGLGTVVVDALLLELDGAPLLGPSGRADGSSFRAADHLGSDEWAVETEHTTDDRKRIDIYLTNDALELAIIVENKLDAAIANPFASYARRAAEQYASVLAVVLAPLRRNLETLGSDTAAWTSAAITYDQLFERFLPQLDAAETANRRSIDLLQQFVENVSEKRTAMDARAENEVLEHFWREIRGRESSYRNFFEALGTVNTILSRRADSLSALIRPRLETAGLLQAAFVTPGYSKSWGLRDGRLAVVYVGFELRNGVTIELIVGFLPKRELYGLHVKAYDKRRGAERPFLGFDSIPIKATLADTDEVIAAAFMETVGVLMKAHPGSPV